MRTEGEARGVLRTAASELVLAPDPRAVREARSFVRMCCTSAGVEGDACDVAELLTSETVTNAFLHGRSEARLVVTVGDGAVLVQVGDDSSRLPELVEHRPDAASGRGLVILDSLAARWGITERPSGKTVWFEVRIDP